MSFSWLITNSRSSLCLILWPSIFRETDDSKSTWYRIDPQSRSTNLIVFVERKLSSPLNPRHGIPVGRVRVVVPCKRQKNYLESLRMSDKFTVSFNLSYFTISLRTGVPVLWFQDSKSFRETESQEYRTVSRYLD